jgi:hypothetical protein
LQRHSPPPPTLMTSSGEMTWDEMRYFDALMGPKVFQNSSGLWCLTWIISDNNIFLYHVPSAFAFCLRDLDESITLLISPIHPFTPEHRSGMMMVYTLRVIPNPTKELEP